MHHKPQERKAASPLCLLLKPIIRTVEPSRRNWRWRGAFGSRRDRVTKVWLITAITKAEYQNRRHRSLKAYITVQHEGGRINETLCWSELLLNFLLWRLKDYWSAWERNERHYAVSDDQQGGAEEVYGVNTELNEQSQVLFLNPLRGGSSIVAFIYCRNNNFILDFLRVLEIRQRGRHECIFGRSISELVTMFLTVRYGFETSTDISYNHLTDMVL